MPHLYNATLSPLPPFDLLLQLIAPLSHTFISRSLELEIELQIRRIGILVIPGYKVTPAIISFPMGPRQLLDAFPYLPCSFAAGFGPDDHPPQAPPLRDLVVGNSLHPCSSLLHQSNGSSSLDPFPSLAAIVVPSIIVGELATLFVPRLKMTGGGHLSGRG